MKYIIYCLIIIAIVSCSNQQQNNHTSTNEATVATGSQSVKSTVVIPDDINELLNKHTCLTCHAAAEKVVGPSYIDVAKRGYNNDEIVSLIYKPKPEHWPDYPPMIGLPQVPKEDALKIAAWINTLK
ncbi:MAG: cytochrome C [Bacteroidia bacterium]|jgi:cytochrome c|nr:cytochrome C [Bacteroidia bacterium]